jgi:BMFP domain-containing protein YqiC
MFGFILNHSNTHKSVRAKNDRLRARVAKLEASLAVLKTVQRTR